MSNREHRDMDLLRQMESEMQRLADEALRGFFSDIPAPNRFWQPRVDMHETPDAVLVKMEIAGMKAERFRVWLSNDDRILTVSGERTESGEERVERVRCYQLEIYFGPFERQIVLPGDARVDRDGIVASYRDGILVVTLPKRVGATLEARSVPVTE